MKQLMKRAVYAAVGITVLVIVVGFVVLNGQTIELNFRSFSQTVEVPVLIVTCFVAGALVGMAASLFAIIRLKREIAMLRRDQHKHRVGGEALRAIPLR